MLTVRRGNIFQFCIQALINKYALEAEELRKFNVIKKGISKQINKEIFAKSRSYFPRCRVVDHQPWTKTQVLKSDSLKVEAFVSPHLPDKNKRSVVHAVLPASRRRLNPEFVPGSDLRYHCEAFEDSLKAGISGRTNLLLNCELTFCADESQWTASIRAAKENITGQAANVQLRPEGLKAFAAMRVIRDKMEGMNQLKDWHLQVLVQSADPAAYVMDPDRPVIPEQPAGITVQEILFMLRELEKGEGEDWPFVLRVDNLVLLELDELSLNRMKKDANVVFRNPTHFVRDKDAIEWNILTRRIHAA